MTLNPTFTPPRTLPVAAKAGGGFQSEGLVAEPLPETATLFYELEFSGTTPLYQGSGNAHPGGGYIQFLANSENGVGDGINGTNIDHVEINDDPLFPGTVKALRDTYQAGGAAYSFANQTLFVEHPETQRTYRRMRIRWSDNWQWGSDQLKFCKNKGPGLLSTNCPKFTGNSMYLTKYAPANGSNEQFVYPTQAQADAQGNPDYYIADDINNGFGSGGSDAAFTPVNGQWYWLEWEIDCGTAGQADGWYRIWIDGQLYMSIDDVQVRRVSDGGFDSFELGHVWQNGSPTQDIYMDWHSLTVWDQRPDNLPAGIA